MRIGIHKMEMSGERKMNILVLADEESKYLWDHYDRKKLEGIDLIISCGDLKPAYLSFLATFTHAPVLYIHGNHDGCYQDTPPEGCICIDNNIFEYNGIRILGVGGSMLYNFGPFQYSQKDMKKRVAKLRRKIKRKKGIDILVTHAPAYRLGDTEDMPHTGFRAFNELLDEFAPKYHLHGHIHLTYNWRMERVMEYNSTKIINGYERYLFDYETGKPPEIWEDT